MLGPCLAATQVLLLGRSDGPEPVARRSAGGPVAALEIDRWVAERRQPGDVGGANVLPAGGEVVEGGLDVHGLLQRTWGGQPRYQCLPR